MISLSITYQFLNSGQIFFVEEFSSTAYATDKAVLLFLWALDVLHECANDKLEMYLLMHLVKENGDGKPVFVKSSYIFNFLNIFSSGDCKHLVHSRYWKN